MHLRWRTTAAWVGPSSSISFALSTLGQLEQLGGCGSSPGAPLTGAYRSVCYVRTNGQWHLGNHTGHCFTARRGTIPCCRNHHACVHTHVKGKIHGVKPVLRGTTRIPRPLDSPALGHDDKMQRGNASTNINDGVLKYDAPLLAAAPASRILKEIPLRISVVQPPDPGNLCAPSCPDAGSADCL